jgi:quercetin dioxygenase-like cupin family protein
MNRRDFLASTAAFTLAQPSRSLWPCVQVAGNSNQSPELGIAQRVVLIRSGFTRKSDGTDERATSETIPVRSSDSEGRLAVFLVPVGEHQPYRGAPLHVHHAQDEWIHIVAGEFVAEVGGKRMRLKPGDSLLMPMKIPHRWSAAQESHRGAIHLYTPAGLMDVEWASVAQDEDPKNQEARKAEFERHGVTLLGGSLSKDEIDRIL